MAGESNESDLLAAIIGELKTALSLPDARCYPVFAPNTQKPNFTGSGNYVLQVSLGDPQALQDEQGQEIARGLANYAAAEARLLCRKPSHEFEALLGYTAEPEMVHRDNLILSR